MSSALNSRLLPALACITVGCADVQQPNRSVPLASHSDHALLAAHTPGGARQASVTPLVVAEYTTLDGASATGDGGSIKLSVNAGGEIPRHPDSFIESVAVFGFAWADLATGNGIVAVLHPAIGRDSRQNPDGWHTHTVLLAGGTTGTGGTSDFCIAGLGRSQAGIAIHDDELVVSMSGHWAGLSTDELDVAAAFVVQPDTGCSATGLGVDVLATADL